MKTTRKAGTSGWTGGSVTMMSLDDANKPKEVARIWVEGQTLRSSDPKLLNVWEQEGIVGRASAGRLYPKDGKRFVDELPFTYKSPYLWAKPSED